MKDSQMYMMLLHLSNMSVVLTGNYLMFFFSGLFFISQLVSHHIESKKEDLK